MQAELDDRRLRLMPELIEEVKRTTNERTYERRRRRRDEDRRRDETERTDVRTVRTGTVPYVPAR